MRILRIFFTAIVLIGVFGALVGLMAREVLLYMGLNQLRAATLQLNTIQVDTGFISSCVEYTSFSLSGDQALTRTQLRFITSKEYLVEIICQNASFLRREVRREMLPPLVEKEPGQSGIIYGADQAGVVVTILGRSGAVFQEDNFTYSSMHYDLSQESAFAVGPATACQGYGFECCNEAYQTGQDFQNTQALDCPRSCFASCVDKPIVLNFQSEPLADQDTRTVAIQAGEAIRFYYTINDIEGDAFARALLATNETQSWLERVVQLADRLFNNPVPRDNLAEIVIHFGDGQSVTVSDLQGTVEHTYTCSQSRCDYTASVQAKTERGIISSMGNLSKLEVQVLP